MKLNIILILLLFASVIVIAGTFSDKENLGEAATINISDYPDNIKNAYPLFLKKCSKCHGIEKAVNPKFTPEQYQTVIETMKSKPFSGINQKAADEIYEFLKYYVENQNEKN